MSKSNSWEGDLNAYVFNATAIPWNAITQLFVSLHTADPGEAGSQTTNEATYGSYARVAVNRNSGGWTVSGNAVENAAAIVFPTCTSGTNTISHFGIGTLTSGTGVLLYKGGLTANLAVSTGIEPRFAAGALDITED
jgi:hypothetical protein